MSKWMRETKGARRWPAHLACLLLLPAPASTLSLPARLISTPALVLDLVDRVGASCTPSAPSEYWLSCTADGQLSASSDPRFAVDAIPDERMLFRVGISSAGRAIPYESDTPVGTRELLSDERVTIHEFRLRPDERCPYHHHQLPYCFVNLSTSLTQALDEDGSDVGEPNLQHEGQAVWVPSNALGSHAVRNVGKTEFLQFIIECKCQPHL